MLSLVNVFPIVLGYCTHRFNTAVTYRAVIKNRFMWSPVNCHYIYLHFGVYNFLTLRELRCVTSKTCVETFSSLSERLAPYSCPTTKIVTATNRWNSNVVFVSLHYRWNSEAKEGSSTSLVDFGPESGVSCQTWCAHSSFLMEPVESMIHTLKYMVAAESDKLNVILTHTSDFFYWPFTSAQRRTFSHCTSALLYFTA